MSLRTAACLTVRNERETIGELVKELVERFDLVFVADAASPDGTAEAASAAGATLVAPGRRMSIAEGLVETWFAAVNAGADIIVVLDAGGSHSPLEAAGLARQMVAAGADAPEILSGSRFRPGGSYEGGPLWRVVGSVAMAALLSAITGRRHTDWTTSMRAYEAGALLRLYFAGSPFSAQMHGFSAELLLNAEALGLEIEERPIGYAAGRSSFRWADALRLVWIGAKFALRIRRADRQKRRDQEKGDGEQ